MKIKQKKFIITSLLDVDFYKLTMMQMAFLFFRTIPVKFRFKNRTVSLPLSKFVKEKDLRAELDHVRTIKGINDREERYLRSLKVFGKKYIAFFKELVLPEYTLKRGRDSYVIEFSGAWPEVTLWETICLSITNELYYRSLLKRMTKAERVAVYIEGKKRLYEKIAVLKENPCIKFIEFGTRRRFSKDWQEYVLRTLMISVPENLVGTSNVYMAMKLGLKPVGTFAHEMFMVFSGIYRGDLKASHNKVLEYWWDLYGKALSIALTDTYGSDFFFEDMTFEQAKKWIGLRHDSGDPIEFGEKAIKFYKSYGIKPMSKTVVFSDGLDIEMILKLANHFKGRINVSFGWGTNLTNDLGLKSLSLVVKAIEAMGHGTVKLSDNLAKAMGSVANIELFKETFGNNVTLKEECVY